MSTITNNDASERNDYVAFEAIHPIPHRAIHSQDKGTTPMDASEYRKNLVKIHDLVIPLDTSRPSPSIFGRYTTPSI